MNGEKIIEKEVKGNGRSRTVQTKIWFAGDV